MKIGRGYEQGTLKIHLGNTFKHRTSEGIPTGKIQETLLSLCG